MQTCPRERLVVKRNSGKGCETGNSGLTPCSGSGLGVFVAYLFACFCHQGRHSSLLVENRHRKRSRFPSASSCEMQPAKMQKQTHQSTLNQLCVCRLIKMLNKSL